MPSDQLPVDDPSADLEKARRETRAAFENRALLYRAIFEELAADVGRDRAADIMKRGIRKRGLEVGRKYREAVEARDLRLVGCIFCGDSPCEGALFEPGIESYDGEAIILRMESCPLVDAWESSGLAPEDVDLMCEIAAAVDEGTFDGAGLELTFLDRRGRPGSTRCLLELRLPREG
ncbi:MAG TPA: L-2-amino-thiazoline-4-carboxylic acid hydrolase [Coriobacteriia bacterium]